MTKDERIFYLYVGILIGVGLLVMPFFHEFHDRDWIGHSAGVICLVAASVLLYQAKRVR